MAYKKRSFTVTTDAGGDGTKVVGLGAAFGRIMELVIDDSASTEAAVVFKLTDDRGRDVYTADAVDVSEGPFYKPTGEADPALVYNGVIAKSPVTVDVASGGNALTYTGSFIVEV
jgi:hypothetical protein